MSGNQGQAPKAPAVSARTHQQEIRDLVLARYGNLARASLPHRLRFHLKRAGWVGVVRGAYLVKRMLDILVSGTLLVLLLPFFLLLALAIRIESPGPVLFKQTRVGRWGELFTMWKFRSM